MQIFQRAKTSVKDDIRRMCQPKPEDGPVMRETKRLLLGADKQCPHDQYLDHCEETFDALYNAARTGRKRH